MGDPLVDLKKTKTIEECHQPNHEKSTVQGALYGRSGALSGEAYDKNKAMMLSKEELELAPLVQRLSL